MQLVARCLLLLVASAPVALAENVQTNPLAKVIQMIDELAAKITKDGEAEAAAFKEYFEWCDDMSRTKNNEIKTATAQKEKLEAQIQELGANIEASTSKIEELVSSVAKGDGELKDATAIRVKEVADFSAGEAELVDAVDTLDRAISIIGREMQKNPAALAQIDTTNMKSLVQSLSVVVNAAAFASSDREKLLALVQSQQGSDDADGELGAPAAAVYESHSSSIVDVLEDMKEKAEGQLSDLRKAETNTKHNFEMLKQSLEDQMAADNKSLNEEKANMAADSESKAGAEGDLEVTKKALADSKDTLATGNSNCMQLAADHEGTMKARAEELAAVAQAKKILEETSSGAVSQTYSLLQISVASQLQTRADLSHMEVITLVKKLAQAHHSAALAQLASKIAAIVRYGGASSDVFAKVKGLINELINKLEKEAAEEATEKAFCDEEMAKTEAKKADIEGTVAKLSATIDQAAAKSAELKEQVKELQAELAALAKQQAEMDKIRGDTHADFVQAKADLELGLDGVRRALNVLRDYYGSQGAAMLQDDASMQQPAMPEKHSASTGAGQSIIGILEVCESDFASNLAKEETEEADAESEYETMTQENKVTKTNKDQDVKYKTAEHKGLDKSIGELSGDRDTSQAELNAVLEYYSKLKDRCVAKPETYEERKSRRAAEISGLKDALNILENETAFVQRKGRGLRGRILAQ
jgi:peptidoglycan hydrolase CwlO-like protein